MDMMDSIRRYGAIFIKGSEPTTWPLYIGIAIIFAWLALLTVSVVSLKPDLSTLEAERISQSMRLVGWLGLMYLLLPIFYGLIDVAGAAWRDIR